MTTEQTPDLATAVVTPETVAPATNKRWYVVHALSLIHISEPTRPY